MADNAYKLFVMIYKHKHIKDLDLGETIPNLHIDLEKAVENHVIRDTGIIPEFNGIENAEEVGELVRDNLRAIDAKNEIAARMREMELRQIVQTQVTQSKEAAQESQLTN